MRTLVLFLIGVMGSFIGSAHAQTVDVDDETIFIEGHVFDRRTGVPISGALVVLPDPCFICASIPEPVEIITDDNGFFGTAYRPVPRSAGFTISITASCVGQRGIYSGETEAILRPGTIRRDIYLRIRERISRCRPAGPTR
jgi:hypothetical protein